MGQFITVIVKPTMDCNIQCKHCYHLPSERSSELMDIKTFDKAAKLVKNGFDSTRFIFHGGEPTLAPISFYKNAMSVEKKYFGKFNCENTIQTNGTLLNKRFIEFCRNNRINIGISYEGGFDSDLRPGMDSEKIDDIVKYMVDKKHMFLISSTIHGRNVNDMEAIYDKFTKMGATIMFNPLIQLGCATQHPELRLDPDVYADNLIVLFDKWMHDVDVKVPALPFYQYISTALNGTPNISDCPHASCLLKWICIYPNGDAYPCGKACPKEYCLGNVNDVDTIEELLESDGMINILESSIERRKKCKDCDIYQYCNGGCSIDARAEGDINSPGGFSCIVYKKLFSHIKSTIDGIMADKPDMMQYNGFVREAILGRLVNPQIIDDILQ